MLYEKAIHAQLPVFFLRCRNGTAVARPYKLLLLLVACFLNPASLNSQPLRELFPQRLAIASTFSKKFGKGIAGTKWTVLLEWE
jgi:hypothetical protein